MGSKHPFIKILFVLLFIILICLGIIWWKTQNPDTFVFHEQTPIAEEQIGQNEQEGNTVKQNMLQNQVEVVNQSAEVVAPILGTLEKPTVLLEDHVSEQTGYFYKQLDGNAKKIYEAVVNHTEQMKNGNYKISLADTFQSVLTASGGEQILKQAYQDAWDALMTDFVDLFYLDTSKIYLYINSTKVWNIVNYEVSIGPEEGRNYYMTGYTCKQDVEEALSALQAIQRQCVASVSGTTYQKIKQVNDWIVDALSYDQTLNRTNTRNIYGAFIEKQVVCEGYAKAFQYIMDGLEIPCILVSGTASNSEGKTEAHLWNYVQIEGNWYAVDVTWNDPIIQGGGSLTNQMKHAYLCKGQSFLKNHVPNGRVSQTGMTFEYPTLNVKDY